MNRENLNFANAIFCYAENDIISRLKDVFGVAKNMGKLRRVFLLTDIMPNFKIALQSGERLR